MKTNKTYSSPFPGCRISVPRRVASALLQQSRLASFVFISFHILLFVCLLLISSSPFSIINMERFHSSLLSSSWVYFWNRSMKANKAHSSCSTGHRNNAEEHSWHFFSDLNSLLLFSHLLFFSVTRNSPKHLPDGLASINLNLGVLVKQIDESQQGLLISFRRSNI